MAGIRHRIEVGLNLNGIAFPVQSKTTPTFTFKWKAYDGGAHGWEFVAGKDVFVPVQNRNYSAGDYVYAEFANTLAETEPA